MQSVVEMEFSSDGLARLAGLIRDQSFENRICVLKNVVQKELLDQLVAEVWKWGQATPTAPVALQSFGEKNFKMAITTSPPPPNASLRSTEFDIYSTPTSHVLYRLADLASLADVVPTCVPVADQLSRIHNSLTKSNFPVEDGQGLKLNLEIIHYPGGGGYMGKHNHTHHHPAGKLSMILGLAKRGKDYQSGATFFEIEGRTIDTTNIHDQGDLLIFSGHITHWVTPCDTAEEVDFTSSKGRWTALLPLYASRLTEN